MKHGVTIEAFIRLQALAEYNNKPAPKVYVPGGAMGYFVDAKA